MRVRPPLHGPKKTQSVAIRADRAGMIKWHRGHVRLILDHIWSISGAITFSCNISELLDGSRVSRGRDASGKSASVAHYAKLGAALWCCSWSKHVFSLLGSGSCLLAGKWQCSDLTVSLKQIIGAVNRIRPVKPKSAKSGGTVSVVYSGHDTPIISHLLSMCWGLSLRA